MPVARGVVRSASDQSAVAGAAIRLVGTSLTCATDSSGAFEIALVCDTAADRCTLEVSAAGYAIKRVVALCAGDTVSLAPVLLQSTVTELGRSTVVARRTGQAESMDRQRNADNLTSVIDAEMIRTLPDRSAADALQRVSGVSLQREQGEGRYIMIRGTESRLSTVTINGQTISSPDAETRATALNVVPSEQLARVEVSKVLTPEMDGDAIGGTVNLVTATARSARPELSLSLSPGYTALSGEPLVQGAASLGKRFLGQRLGAIIAASYYRDHRQTDDVEIMWNTSLHIATQDRNVRYYDLQFRQYNRTNTRVGLNTRLDYRLATLGTAWLSADYNQLNAHELRRRLILHPQSDDARPLDDPAYVKDVPVTRGIREREKDQRIAGASAGAQLLLGTVALDLGAAYSYAHSLEPFRHDASFSRQYSIRFDSREPDLPGFFPFDQTAYSMSELYYQLLGTPRQPDLYDTTWDDMSLFVCSKANVQRRESTEHTLSGYLNAQRSFDLGSSVLELKSGIKAVQHTKSEAAYYTSYEMVTPSSALRLSNFLDSYRNPEFYDGAYVLDRMPRMDRVLEYFVTNPSGDSITVDSISHQLDIDPLTYDARDRNGAGYLQGTWTAGRLRLIGGLRVEYSSLWYTGILDSTVGQQATFYSARPVSMYRQFTIPLPSLVSRLSITDRSIVRVSYTRSFSRPDWMDLVPRTVYSSEDGIYTVMAGNPDLRPTTAHNVDLSFEHYLRPDGLVYGGLFYKRMDDYVFSGSTVYYREGGKELYTLYTKRNGDGADLAGAELNLVEQFRFLPAFLSGLGVSANYTYTWSQTVVPGLSGTSALPGQSAHVANAALFYEKYGFSARLALNLQSDFIYEISSYRNRDGQLSAGNSTHVDDHVQLDCSLGKKLGSHVSVLLQLNNLTNEPHRVYQGDKRHMIQKEYYSWSAQLGVRAMF